jgi:lipoprotein-releasing system ATP-binding protein
MLLINDIYKRFGNLQVLKGITLKIEQGEIAAIIGKSGAGKSTLLHIAGTLEKADSGDVSLAGTSISSLKGKELATFRNNHIGFVFQFHYLMPEFTARENILMPAYLGKSNKLNESEAFADRLIDMLGLKERQSHKPTELSGGEQQRVAIARALINKPRIILADEPTGNLDTTTSEEIHNLFLNLREELNQTFVIVTHNPALAGICDRSIEMADGLIINA